MRRRRGNSGEMKFRERNSLHLSDNVTVEKRAENNSLIGRFPMEFVILNESHRPTDLNDRDKLLTDAGLLELEFPLGHASTDSFEAL